MTDSPPALAALVFPSETPVDDLLVSLLAEAAQGDVFGWVQGFEADSACCSDIVVRPPAWRRATAHHAKFG